MTNSDPVTPECRCGLDLWSDCPIHGKQDNPDPMAPISALDLLTQEEKINSDRIRRDFSTFPVEQAEGREALANLLTALSQARQQLEEARQERDALQVDRDEYIDLAVSLKARLAALDAALVTLETQWHATDRRLVRHDPEPESASYAYASCADQLAALRSAGTQE